METILLKFSCIEKLGFEEFGNLTYDRKIPFITN